MRRKLNRITSYNVCYTKLLRAARDSVEALVRMEEEGLLPKDAATRLARRMDEGRDALLSLALGRRLGA